ncbi:Xylulose kinase [bioreactor metagenome]|uniref:Xylulose kinase n=1 Tax=bioreactor metagenome TaxID=1076179 RepID=A0A645HSY2_9ZZZZ
MPPGSEGLILLPHCAGSVSPVSNPDARGVAWGITLAHGKAHWARAILESVAYLLADNIGVLNELIGPVAEIRALGGASESPLWMRIFADTLKLPVTVTDCAEATSLGAAMLAATAVGAHPDLTSAAAGMVRVRERFEPGPEAARYPEYLARYRALNQLILPTFGGKQ